MLRVCFLLEPPLSFSFYFTLYLAYSLCKDRNLLCYNLRLFFRELFLGNMVTQLMKIPQLDDPINTPKDLEKSNITIFKEYYIFDNHKMWYSSVNTSEWNYLANTMVPADYSCLKGTPICAEINGTWE